MMTINDMIQQFNIDGRVTVYVAEDTPASYTEKVLFDEYGDDFSLFGPRWMDWSIKYIYADRNVLKIELEEEE